MSPPTASPRGGGRPETPPKNQSKKAVKVYLTAEEKHRVKESAARTGLSLSGYGRRRLLYKDHPLFEAVLKTDLRMLACTLKDIETVLSTGTSGKNSSSSAGCEAVRPEGVASHIRTVLRSIETQMKALDEAFGR